MVTANLLLCIRLELQTKRKQNIQTLSSASVTRRPNCLGLYFRTLDHSWHAVACVVQCTYLNPLFFSPHTLAKSYVNAWKVAQITNCLKIATLKLLRSENMSDPSSLCGFLLGSSCMFIQSEWRRKSDIDSFCCYPSVCLYVCLSVVKNNFAISHSSSLKPCWLAGTLCIQLRAHSSSASCVWFPRSTSLSLDYSLAPSRASSFSLFL